MNRIGIAVILTCVICGCAGPTIKVGQPEAQTCRSFNIDYSNVALPDRIGTVSKIEQTRLKEEKAGLMVRYSRPDIGTSTIDVFVYPICVPKHCSLAKINEMEMLKVVKEVQTVHPGAEVKKVESFVGELDGKRYEALKAKIDVPKDRRLASFVYLSLKDDVYVKIRFTQPEGSDYESHLDGVAASLLTEFKFGDPQVHKRQTAPTIFYNPAETKHKKSYMLEASLSYGAFISIEIEKGRFLDSLERELACWEPALRMLEIMEAKEPREALDATFAGMIAARNAGYFKEYLWVYFRRPYWIQPPNFKLDEFKVWASHNLKGHIPFDTNRVAIEWK
jgi:hypothetical protein